MERHLTWRDESIQISTNPESWVPQATVDLVEADGACYHTLLLSSEDSGRIKQGHVLYPTRGQAHVAARRLAESHAWKQWGLPVEMVRESVWK